MSKVEVKKGDEFRIAPIGSVWQIRDEQRRCVLSHGELCDGEWLAVFCDSWPTLPTLVARAWIESLGGTVVEEREEEKGGEVTLHVYHHPSTGQVFMFKETAHGLPVGKYLGTTTIHIAGVTT